MAKSQDINLIIGDAWHIVCTCRDADGHLLPITDAEWRMSTSNNRVFLASVSNGEITITGNGKCEILVDPDIQSDANVQPGVYYHELFVSGASTNASIQVVGKARLEQSLKVQYP